MSKPAQGPLDLFDLIAAVGLALACAGAAWVYPPAGVVLLGAVLFVIGIRGA